MNYWHSNPCYLEFEYLEFEWRIKDFVLLLQLHFKYKNVISDGRAGEEFYLAYWRGVKSTKAQLLINPSLSTIGPKGIPVGPNSTINKLCALHVLVVLLSSFSEKSFFFFFFFLENNWTNWQRWQWMRLVLCNSLLDTTITSHSYLRYLSLKPKNPYDNSTLLSRAKRKWKWIEIEITQYPQPTRCSGHGH